MTRQALVGPNVRPRGPGKTFLLLILPLSFVLGFLNPLHVPHNAYAAVSLPDTTVRGDGLFEMARFIGKYSFSADGLAAVEREGNFTVEKPAGASVEAAFLVAASRYRKSTTAPDVTLLDGLDETAVTFSHRSGGTGGTEVVNWLADVTALIGGRIDAASAGPISIPADYNSNNSADSNKLYSGIALTVIFADPNVEAGTTIFQFGHAAAAGETTTLEFDAISAVPTEAPLSLGISWSIQVSSIPEGYSRVRISTSSNPTPQVLTEYAGGYDDAANAASFNYLSPNDPLKWPLVTVGGVGDSILNPVNPAFAGWSNYASDDELYNLAGFLQSGDTSITLDTVNPSNDDSIFQVVLSIPGVLANSTVTFSANTGSGSDYTQDGSGPTALRTNTFTKDGYMFTNWATNPDGSGQTYLDGATFPFTEDDTLYAQWEVAPASNPPGATTEATDSTKTVELAATGVSTSQWVAIAAALSLLGGMTISSISMRLRGRRSEG